MVTYLLSTLFFLNLIASSVYLLFKALLVWAKNGVNERFRYIGCIAVMVLFLIPFYQALPISSTIKDMPFQTSGYLEGVSSVIPKDEVVQKNTSITESKSTRTSGFCLDVQAQEKILLVWSVGVSALALWYIAVLLRFRRRLPQSKDRDVLLNNLGYAGFPHVICLSDYNNLLELAGEPTLELASDEAAIYRDSSSTNEVRNAMLNEILAKHPKAELDGKTIFLTGEVQSIPLVTDSSITLDIALIVPDEQFFYYTQGNYNVYVNGILDQNITNEMGLMGAYSTINEVLDMIDLDALGLEYESYLQSMGRQLFYMVAASYITSYLAIIFLVVSNTIIGVQFLMNQQRTGRRYQTLVRLGATYHALCGSARKQITWFMGLPVIVAAISSLFGVKSLFAGILSSEVKNAQGEMLVIAAIIILILCVVECIYMTVIKRSSDRYLLTLMQPQREE